LESGRISYVYVKVACGEQTPDEPDEEKIKEVFILMTKSAAIQSSEAKAASSTGAQALPFLFKNPVVLQADLHRGKALAPHTDFNFAAKTNAIPVVVSEFMPVVRNFPIVFTKSARPSPIALVGLRQDENLHVGTDGSWKAGAYVPAYLRRYPFVLSETGNKDTVMLAVDAGSERFVDAATVKGAELFFVEGSKASELSTRMLDFCRAYHAEALQTEAFVKLLTDADLLTEQQADMRFADNSQYKLEGFLVVDAEKLKALPAEKIKELHDSGALAAITLHLVSLQNWQLLLDLQAQLNNEKKS
jgi:hypothetical protein